MKTKTILRYVGTSLLVYGYFFMLSYDLKTGLIIRLIGNTLTLPWAISNKVWDLVFLIGLFTVYESHLLYTKIFT